MRRSVLLVPVLTALAVGLAACSDETPGTALPGDDTTSADRPTLPGGAETTDPSEDTSSSEPNSDDNPLADVQPCDLVSDDGAAQLGLTDEEEDQFGESRVCLWNYEGTSISDRFSVGVELFEKRGLKDVVAEDVKPIPPIGGHEAVTYTGSTGGCAVGIGVSESSRVDTRAVGSDSKKGCQLAMELATLVEPELP